jgi:hypothetical protein
MGLLPDFNFVLRHMKGRVADFFRRFRKQPVHVAVDDDFPFISLVIR